MGEQTRKDPPMHFPAAYQAQINDYQRQAAHVNRTAWMVPAQPHPRRFLRQRVATILLALGTSIALAPRHTESPPPTMLVPSA
jgi:hypothetical protein